MSVQFVKASAGSVNCCKDLCQEPEAIGLEGRDERAGVTHGVGDARSSKNLLYLDHRKPCTRPDMTALQTSIRLVV